jgi:hypothetical protein
VEGYRFASPLVHKMSELISFHCATPNPPTFAVQKTRGGARSPIETKKKDWANAQSFFLAGAVDVYQEKFELALLT